MKIMIKISSIFVLFIMLMACATTQSPLPDKYTLDDDLKAVEQISAFSVSGWEQVDNQSIILRANGNQYYLLILRRPIESMISNLTIGISSQVTSITSGYDKIFVLDPVGIQYYVIEKIYKLKGKEQKKEIKERLGKK